MATIKLFCFPFAGGAAAAFNPWKPLLADHIELRNVELAGRGRRIREPLYDSIPEAVDDVYNIIKEELDKGPYALYGHSMGSVITFELAYKIRENNLPEPIHIFFSGRGAPHMPTDDKKKHHLMPDDEFKREMITLGGMSDEFFKHPELLEVFLPLLRGDFKVHENYQYTEKPARLNCSITVLNGTEDEEVLPEEIEEWRKHTDHDCIIHNFPGDHFFINKEKEAIVNIINSTLTPL